MCKEHTCAALGCIECHNKRLRQANTDRHEYTKEMIKDYEDKISSLEVKISELQVLLHDAIKKLGNGHDLL